MNSRMAATQQAVRLELNRHAAGRLEPASIRWELHRAVLETTQRSRGLLFLAAGVAVAWTLGHHELRVYENGVGAINLPYLRSQVGPQATRAVHPRTLALMQRLVSDVTGESFAIVNPFLHLTKAEVVAATGEDHTTALAASVSCDSGFSSRMPGGQLCGHCTSCLLRRQALMAAGREDLIIHDHYRPQRNAMLWQAGRLREALETSEPWLGLVDEFPELLALPDAYTAATREQLVGLYRRYCQEWQVVAPLLGGDQEWWRSVVA